jgi:hypothetical protein
MQAFPSELEADVLTVVAILPETRTALSVSYIGPVTLAGQPIQIPARLYHPEPPPADVDRLSPRQALILGCLYTRNHDGYVRERALREIIASHEPWVTPFVVQLLGEYVIQILYLLDQQLTEEHRPVYSAFLAENSAFFELTRQRVISYWDCYYRGEFPRRRDEYVGMRLLRRLESWRDSGVGEPGCSSPPRT